FTMDEFKITFLPEHKSVSVDRGTDLLTAALKTGVHIYNSCGGEGVCGRCKVIVKKGDYITEGSGRVSEVEREEGYVLACRTSPKSDMEVFVPEESRLGDLEILTEEIKGKRLAGLYTPVEEIEEGHYKTTSKIFKHSPLSTKIFLKLPEPTIDDNSGDADRLLREVKKQHKEINIMQMGLSNIKRLPMLLRESNWEVTVTIGNRNKTTEVVLIEPGNRAKENFGIAVDIGTTTIVAYLVDLNSQKVLGSKASYNPQVDFGEDVISRIIFAQQEKGLEKLHHAVIDTINNLIGSLIKESGLTLDDLTAVVSAGNTTMTHILLKIDPAQIRKDPYIPAVNFMPVIRAGETGIKINPRGLLACLPCIGSYVGGDIVAGVLASGMDKTKDLSLFIDLGTNGEVVLGNKEWLMSCSTSAGPCFEGGGLKCGIRAMKGAIQNISVKNNSFEAQTIGNLPPKGICGSGVVDIVSELLKNKIIDRSGKIKDNKICEVRDCDGVKELVLVGAKDSATGKDITIDENDIKNLIHSKGAIYTGIEVLLKEAGFEKSDIKHVFIAGGLGTALNIRSAINIGLLPDLPEKSFVFLGNTSVAGAKMCLLSYEATDNADAIANKMAYLDLSTSASFMNNYSAALFLPHTDIESFPSVKKILTI
ncbi:MAG: ASKHA domain-containing protein, partial [Candidatus Omnitrophota bacterium]|nr:ASKHA domain-containing protein [Candidatus Omnitrophota bacterium]